MFVTQQGENERQEGPIHGPNGETGFFLVKPNHHGPTQGSQREGGAKKKKTRNQAFFQYKNRPLPHGDEGCLQVSRRWALC
jgi:hypothetical protein